LVSLDQFSKAFLIEFLEAQPGYVFYINSFLDIVHTWNYGISFGLFSEYQKYSNVIFLISNSLIILYLIVTYVLDEKSSKLYLLIISGGLGNLLDRIFRGAVFDFIHVHYQNYHFPVFNIADMLISIGICLFILEVFLKSSPKKSIST
jgi:signal peptidase II